MVMMVETNHWLVPEGIEDILPRESKQIEQWRRVVLDEFSRWGYDLVIPPMVEFVEALLTGTATDLRLDTCQLVDQVSGRMMGVRSDLTPQVARIDAHRLKSLLPVRLCYAAEVLRSRPDAVTGSRSPIQMGAELFGHSGIQSDIEVIELMLAVCERIGLSNITLTLGHVGLFENLVSISDLSPAQAAAAHKILERKALPEWDQWCAEMGFMSSTLQQLWTHLPRLCGSSDQVMPKASKMFGSVDAVFDQALNKLSAVVNHLSMTHPALSIHVDLSDLRGFEYHTGIVFGLIEPNADRLIASGGRYDDIGKAFGRARAATGFSIDLRQLLALSMPSMNNCRFLKRILAPAVRDLSLIQKIQQLRQEGHSVVIGFPDVSWEAQKKTCDAELVQENGSWVMR